MIYRWKNKVYFLLVILLILISNKSSYAESVKNDVEIQTYNLLLDSINDENLKSKKDINKGEALRYLQLKLQESKSEKMSLWEENERLKGKLEIKFKKEREKENQELEKQKEIVRKKKEEDLKRQKKIKQENQRKEKENKDRKSNKQSIYQSNYKGSRHDNLLAPSGVTIEDIDNVLKGSKLEGDGKIYLYAEQVTGVNAAFLASISILESNWGRSRIAQDKNNLYGYGAYNASPYQSAYHFKTKAHGTIYVAMKLRENYLDPGGKYYNGPSVEGVNVRYSVTDSGNTNFRWSQNVKRLMKQMNCY